MTREDIVSECGRERIYMTYDFNYPHDPFQRIVEVVPIFRYRNGRMLLVEVEVRRKFGENLQDLLVCTALNQNMKFIAYCMTIWQRKKDWKTRYLGFPRN
jgi:hypothetical protein